MHNHDKRIQFILAEQTFIHIPDSHIKLCAQKFNASRAPTANLRVRQLH